MASPLKHSVVRGDPKIFSIHVYVHVCVCFVLIHVPPYTLLQSTPGGTSTSDHMAADRPSCTKPPLQGKGSYVLIW